MKSLFVALRVSLLTLLLTGLAYPLLATGAAQLLFPHQARGSLLTDRRGVIGSQLIAQRFVRPSYFQPRPSAAGSEGYDGQSSGGSNLGPTAKKLRERATAEALRLQRENPDAGTPIPSELLTASGSGLDPHLSPAGALWQVARVAKARSVAPERVRLMVEAMTEGRQLGLLGEPRVNVLLLNLALDQRLGSPVP
jgi:K+-transporting ATPase ATPase C chain